MSATLKAGDVVKVGPRYVMADHPPFVGRGRFEADGWTGRTLRVVTPTSPNEALMLPAGADLAPADVPDADADVWICAARLTVVKEET